MGWVSQNQSGSVLTTIYFMQCNTSPSYWVNQVVNCRLWNVDLLLFSGCAKLLDIGRKWTALSYRPMMSDHWLTRPVSLLAKQKLGRFHLPGKVRRTMNMGLCCIMLPREAMVVDDSRNTGLQDLIVPFLWFQISIITRHPCSWSKTFPTVTMGHSTLQHWGQQTSLPQSAICPVQIKARFICEENTAL